MPIIALNHLHAHPANANRMADDTYGKLRTHIERWGEYPPLIVRPHPEIAGEFEILDGHHRARILRELNRTRAHCEVWNASDERATLLLLTLNRLHGEDDPQRRGALFQNLLQNASVHEVAKLVPEDGDRIAHLIQLTQVPLALPEPPPLHEFPQGLTFFLLPAQRKKVLDHLEKFMGDRSQALLAALQLE